MPWRTGKMKGHASFTLLYMCWKPGELRRPITLDVIDEVWGYPEKARFLKLSQEGERERESGAYWGGFLFLELVRLEWRLDHVIYRWAAIVCCSFFIRAKNCKCAFLSFLCISNWHSQCAPLSSSCQWSLFFYILCFLNMYELNTHSPPFIRLIDRGQDWCRLNAIVKV